MTLPFVVPEDVDGIILRCRFHRPSGLENESRVRIAVTTIGALSQVTFNGECIETTPSADESHSVFDITNQLIHFNCLDVTTGSGVTGLTAAVLEIVET